MGGQFLSRLGPWLAHSFTIAILLTATAAAQPQEDPRVVAARALAEGDNAQAYAISVAVLRQNPQDLTSLAIASRAARNLGQFDTAKGAAKRAWILAETPKDKFTTAMLMAQAQASDGNYNTSQFWLRRAVQNAPDNRSLALAVRDFRQVRAANPLSFNISANAAPSSNINGGASIDSYFIGPFEIPVAPEERALSGFRFQLSFGARYRISESARHQTQIGTNLFTRFHRLSSEAKRDAPNARAEEFSFSSVEAFITHKFLPESAQAPYDVTLTVGRNWYGGSTLSNYARLGFGKQFKLGERTRLKLSISGERQKRFDDARRDASVYVLGTSVQHVFASRNSIGVQFSLRDTISESRTTAHEAQIANLYYTWAKPVMGAQITARFGLEKRQYEPNIQSLTGRRDERYRVGLSLFFRDLDYLGFAPQLDFTASHNNSNVPLYDGTEFGVSLNVRSSF